MKNRRIRCEILCGQCNARRNRLHVTEGIRRGTHVIAANAVQSIIAFGRWNTLANTLHLAVQHVAL